MRSLKRSQKYALTICIGMLFVAVAVLIAKPIDVPFTLLSASALIALLLLEHSGIYSKTGETKSFFATRILLRVTIFAGFFLANFGPKYVSLDKAVAFSIGIAIMSVPCIVIIAVGIYKHRS